MNRKPICLIGVVVLAVLAIDQREVNSGESNPVQIVGPRTVVSQWIDLVLSDNLRNSWMLTTKSKNFTAHHDLPRLKNRNRIRVERALGNKSVAVVVTTAFDDLDSGGDRAFAFWLVRRDGAWRIDRSYIEDSKKIDEQLRGFLMAGNPRWLVTCDDIVGTWLAGPGNPGGVGPIACGSRFHFDEVGSFRLETWGPAGPDESDVHRGTWRLKGDRIIRKQGQQGLVSRISWVGPDSLILQSVNRELGDGRSGTHYHRQKPAK